MLLVVQWVQEKEAYVWKKRAEKCARYVKKNEEVIRNLVKKKEQYEGKWWAILCNSVNSYNIYCGPTTINTNTV